MVERLHQSKRRVLRRALLAAVAAAGFSGSPVKAADKTIIFPRASLDAGGSVIKQKKPKAERKPQLKKGLEPTRRHGFQPHTPEHADYFDGFWKLLPKMKGAHLERFGHPRYFQGYAKFCEELRMFCDQFAGNRNDAMYIAEFSPELYARIAKVNSEVNKEIEPKTDLENYGISEKWTVPNGKGDCEDYVLLKMVKLIGEEGLDPADLHILVVKDERGEGHAVLGVDVRVNGVRSTLILDNKHSDIITLDAMETEKKYTGHLASHFIFGRDRNQVRFFTYRSRRSGS